MQDKKKKKLVKLSSYAFMGCSLFGRYVRCVAYLVILVFQKLSILLDLKCYKSTICTALVK
jgi:hypothetical protein